MTEKVMRHMPEGSLVLLNGDLNNNLFKYAHQCDRTRPDLQFLSLQLMSWDWFVPMQAHHYPNITFPGSRYHPYAQGGFSIRTFLDRNQKRFKDRIFLCGPWKDGDESYKGVYHTLPFAMCDKLIKVPKSQRGTLQGSNGQTDLGTAADLRPGVQALPTLEEVIND